MAGVRVGRVDGVGLDGARARVTLRLEQPLQLTARHQGRDRHRGTARREVRRAHPRPARGGAAARGRGPRRHDADQLRRRDGQARRRGDLDPERHRLAHRRGAGDQHVAPDRQPGGDQRRHPRPGRRQPRAGDGDDRQLRALQRHAGRGAAAPDPADRAGARPGRQRGGGEPRQSAGEPREHPRRHREPPDLGRQPQPDHRQDRRRRGHDRQAGAERGGPRPADQRARIRRQGRDVAERHAGAGAEDQARRRPRGLLPVRGRRRH